MDYKEIKQQTSDKTGQLCEEVGLFWAFSEEQFNEGKKNNPIKRCEMVRPGQHENYCRAHNMAVADVTAQECEKQEKYVSIGAGGYLPKANVDRWIEGMKAIEQWEREAVKQTKADKVILYELNNYECFYTGDIEDALPTLTGLGYSIEQIKKVYHEHRPFAIN